MNLRNPPGTGHENTMRPGAPSGEEPTGRPAPASVRLEDRYTVDDRPVYLTGSQALVRLVLEQARRDRSAGQRIGNFVTGYPGSPLGGYDTALSGARSHLDRYGIVHRPAMNEELAATSLWGTQMIESSEQRTVDGVNGFWYGKGPGMDRAGDAIHLGAFAGTSTLGAVTLLSGEDHEAKSSSAPFQQEWAFVHHGIPLLYPSSVAEFVTLGLHAVALSRFSGLWTGLKLVGPLCDGGETFTVADVLPGISLPEVTIAGRPFEKKTDFRFFPGLNIETERQIYEERHPAAVAYLEANGLNRITVSGAQDRIGIAAAGKNYADLAQALENLGLPDDELRRLGIRLFKVGALYPTTPAAFAAFTEGLARIVVVEDKRGFLEGVCREALSRQGRAIPVEGKRTLADRPLFPVQGAMDADIVSTVLGPWLAEQLAAGDPARDRIDAELSRLRAASRTKIELTPKRTPNFCSGCPHNTSTQALDGQTVWGSPGCHIIASVIENDPRHVSAATQYGGEGLPWIGLSPFTGERHRTQNVGDGSLFHSSYLNIRYAVDAGVDITYKILYNGAIANTGAQVPVGQRSVRDLMGLLELDGVAHVALITKSPEHHDRRSLGPRMSVHPVQDYERVLRDLESTPGVTVFIYDEMCANERRRQRKRGTFPAARRLVVINPAVCDNCGDCGKVSNCMSLQKIDTPLGPKTHVHQSSCNQDESCLRGNCPSFLTVEVDDSTALRRPDLPAIAADSLPGPVAPPDLSTPFRIYAPGVGGTGVITANALLAWAALIDGHRVKSFDLTGTAQKWGQVLSSLVIHRAGTEAASSKVGIGAADLYLALDPMAASDETNLQRCSRTRTRAVINTGLLPNGEMTRDITYQAPLGQMIGNVERVTDPRARVCLDAGALAEAFFGDHLATNMICIGAAYQAGHLPLSAEAVEAAIELNAVAVEQNRQAFRLGRLYVADPARLAALAAASSGGPGRPAPVPPAEATLEALVAYRHEQLVAYQDRRLADRYRDRVLQVADAEGRVVPGHDELARTVAVQLHRLLAYKDEYEVARLHLGADVDDLLSGEFRRHGSISYHLEPPILKALGRHGKIEVGPWMRPVFRILAKGKVLRGKAVDPFGHDEVRRSERRLIEWYQALIDEALTLLNPGNHAAVVELLATVDAVRGFDRVKLANIERVTELVDQRLHTLRAGTGSP